MPSSLANQTFCPGTMNLYEWYRKGRNDGGEGLSLRLMPSSMLSLQWLSSDQLSPSSLLHFKSCHHPGNFIMQSFLNILASLFHNIDNNKQQPHSHRHILDLIKTWYSTLESLNSSMLNPYLSSPSFLYLTLWLLLYLLLDILAFGLTVFSQVHHSPKYFASFPILLWSYSTACKPALSSFCHTYS